jgi:triosephosphate isomerase
MSEPVPAAGRLPMIGTSWKMNLLPSTAPAWFAEVVRGTAMIADRELFVLPPFPTLAIAREVLSGTPIRWGGQDVHEDDHGAHTGDVSAPMLADLGCTIAEIGHSERRRDHGETSVRIAGKVRAALRWRLTPVVCIGEHKAGPSDAAIPIVQHQLRGALDGLQPAELSRVVVAYEPAWAIGEGAQAADLGHIFVLHAAIRRWLDARGGPSARVLYGGSVNPGNARGLLTVPEVDGLFVGRAALDPEAFVAIATMAFPAKEGG